MDGLSLLRITVACGEIGERELERWQRDQRLGQTLLALKMEERDHEPRNMDGLQKLEKPMKQILP